MKNFKNINWVETRRNLFDRGFWILLFAALLKAISRIYYNSELYCHVSGTEDGIFACLAGLAVGIYYMKLMKDLFKNAKIIVYKEIEVIENNDEEIMVEA